MTLEAKIENRNKILKGLEKAYEKMLLFKKEHKSDLVIIQDNKIVKIKLLIINTLATAVTINGEKNAKFTFSFRKKFYLKQKIISSKVRN